MEGVDVRVDKTVQAGHEEMESIEYQGHSEGFNCRNGKRMGWLYGGCEQGSWRMMPKIDFIEIDFRKVDCRMVLYCWMI
jgi:hypothetical protein